MIIRKELTAALIAIVTMIVVFGVLYPLVIAGVGQVAFPGNANGQKVYAGGKLVGSKLIGQSFQMPVLKNGKPELKDGEPVTAADPSYFQTRPSGTTPADNDAATAFANYGPNSKVTEQAIAANIAAYIKLNGSYYPGGLTAAKVPVDAADTSASAVDPDISVANAEIQAHRIAAVRHLPLASIDALIDRHTFGRALGFLGESGVDVLELNLALERR